MEYKYGKEIKESLGVVSTLLPLLLEKTPQHAENVSDRNKIETDRQKEVSCSSNLGELLIEEDFGIGRL